MNANILFLIILTLMLAVVYWWGFTHLPGERWQVMASVPRLKTGHHWQAVNLTWYGFFLASACTAGVALLLVLLGALAVPCTSALLLCLGMLAICLPGAKLMARLVEGKRHTLTIGGALFLGVLIAPMLLWSWNRFLPEALALPVPALPVLACLAVTYAFGEGFGRLACISFGCCYGKPVASLPAWLRRIIEPVSFTFRGQTKKIAYAHDLEGVKVIPIQAITTIIHTLTGLVGLWLFLQGAYQAAFLTALITTQLWRVASEFLRADYRGKGSFSAYQIMAGIAVAIAPVLAMVCNAPYRAPHILDGLAMLWDPLPLLFLQGLWVTVFLFTGRSSVTGASISLHVMRERI